MWSKIKEHAVVAWVDGPNGRGVYSIPEGTAALTAERIIEMLSWIYAEFEADAASHPNIFQSENPEERDAFVIRNTSRTLSYINHVCSLELILVRLYREMIEKLQAIDTSVSLDDEQLNARRTEVEDCFTFRNKVSAHTAYGSPRADLGDNEAMEFHSLVALLSSSYEGAESDSFALGAVTIRLGDQTPSTELPRIGLKELHSVIIEHINQWEGMIISKCEAVKETLPVTIGDTRYAPTD